MKNEETTPVTFLSQLAQALKTHQGVDVDLAEIVGEHLLTAVPAAECLEHAMTAIIGLAEARATRPKEHADG